MFDDHTGAGRRLYDESTAAAAAVEGFIGRLLPKKTFTYPYGQYEPHFINYLANNTDYVGATASDLGDTLTTAAYLNSVNIWKVRSIRTPDLVKDKVKNETNIRAGVRAVWGWAVGTGGILSLYQHNNDLTLQEMIWAVDEFNRLGVEWVLFGDHVESIKADHATGDSLTYSKTYPHGDYNLTVGSPAVDAAADVKLTADILGNSYLGMPDIGPYELVNGWKPMSFLKVTLAGSGGGTVSSFPAGVSCSAGVCLSSMVQYTQTDLNATPNPGSVFEGWSGACTGTSTCTLPVAQSADVTATFTRYFTMNSASLGGGAITQSLTLVNYGGSVQFTITPVPGSTFLGLTDNGVAVTAVPGPSGTFIYTINNVTADHFVQAIFKSYTINSTSSGSGSITQSLTSVNYGGSVQFTITPEPGSAFLGLTDNGTAVTAVPGPSGTFMYTISNVTTDHFVQADFSQITGTGGASPVPALGPAGILAAVAGLGMLLRRRMRR
jgi:hypothetical protein